MFVIYHVINTLKCINSFDVHVLKAVTIQLPEVLYMNWKYGAHFLRRGMKILLSKVTE